MTRPVKFYKLVFSVSVLCVSISACYGDCEQRTFQTASVRVCAAKCLNGLSVRGCIGPEDVLDDTRTIEITTKTPVWRRGAIHDLPNLEYVAALSAGVSRLNPGVFVNVPKLKEVKLVFGDIQEIQWGVFNQFPIEKMDLTYNLISYVEDQAFSNMPRLKTVLLSHNKLRDFYQNWFNNSNSVTTLVLQYNEIEKIPAAAFSIFPDLNFLDLSFNHIKEIGGLALNNVRNLNLVDLTSNRLSWIPTNVFSGETVVKEMRLPLNRLSFLSTDVLSNGNVRSLSLHPNPWQCPCLNEVLKWMHDHNATLNNPGDDWRIIYDSTLPECAVNSKSPNKCVVGYDDAFLQAQEIFFREVNYINVVREKPTSERPNFDVLIVDKPFREDLSPLEK